MVLGVVLFCLRSLPAVPAPRRPCGDAPRRAASFLLRFPFFSFSPGINTYGGTGVEPLAHNESPMSREWNSSPGKKLRNAKYYCPAPPPSLRPANRR